LSVDEFGLSSAKPCQAELIELSLPLVQKKGVRLWVKRDDLRHPKISGNKWHKLKHNLIHAREQGYHGILSFGGPYSNHIHALAYACHQNKLKSLAFIRGEAVVNPTLSDALQWGMELEFVSRAEYRKKDTPEYLADLSVRFPDYFIVPEGGSNQLALAGCAELAQEVVAELPGTDCLVVPCGTGGTLAGISQGLDSFSAVDSGVLKKARSVLGMQVLKGEGYIARQVASLLQHSALTNWNVCEDYHFGGYAKVTADLAGFVQRFEVETGIPVEPVYSGKMFYGLMTLIAEDYFEPGSTIVAIHTGGLQGKRGMEDKLKRLEAKANHEELQKLFV